MVRRNGGAASRPKTPTLSLEAAAFLSLQRNADQLQGGLAEVLKPHQISPTQYNALRILRGAGAEGLACGEIAERMINRDPDITRLVDRLQRGGLVARSRGREDHRVMRARITTAGLGLLKTLNHPVEEFHRQTLGHMGARRLRALIQLLDATRRGA